jgi:hypothetical protein
MCKKYLALAASLMISSVLSVSFLTGTASAVSGEALTKKALLNGIKTCATTQYFKAPVSLDDLSGLDNSKLGSLFTSAGKKVGSHTVRIPTMVGNTVKDSDVSCLQLLQGYHKNGQDVKGLAEYSGKTVTQDSLTKIGYRSTTNPDAASVSQECVQITYKDKTKKLLGGEEWNDRETNKYCFWVEDGKIAITPSGDHNVSKTKPGRGKSGAAKLDGEYDKDGSHPGYWLSIWYMDEKDKGHTVLYTSAEQGDREWSDFKNGFANVAANLNKANNIKDAKVNFTVGSDSSKNIARDERALTFGGASSKLAMLKYFAGDDATWDSVKFTEAEKTDLYRKYIKGQIDDGKVKQGECGTLETIKSNQGDKEMYVYQPNANKDNYCILEGADQVTQKFNAPRAGNDILYPESFLTIVTAQMPKEIADKNKEIRNPAPADPDDDGNAEEASQCSKAASSLGWIICPVIQGVGTATDWMYEYIEQEFLVTDADFVATTEKDENGNEVHTGTYVAWTSFRDFANIIFAIALAVVILSQITGFGVSNYGIKKMLPTLIMVAVLVNLSFFLCQLAVDVSNITGYGIKKIFVELGGPSSEFGEGSLGDIIGSTDGGSGILGGLLGLGGAVTVIATAPKWIWPFLVLLLGAAISVMFFFLLLGIRQAGIIILAALSPVAIICYALPNTKNIFSRWWKMFSALLLVYPICGALMGGGQFASKLLLANVNENTGFFYVLVAMLVQTVPFFFVPSILKSSMAAMGNLGMKLSSFGRGLSRGTTGMVRKSDGYKYRVAKTQAKSANRALKRQAWRDSHGLSVRGRASGWAGRGGIRGAIGDAAKSSRDHSQERRINAVAAQRRAEQNAAFVAEGGLANAERRERDAAMKNYEASYRGDDTFMNDFAAQSRAYDAAIQAVDDDPSDMNARAQLRALQNVLGSSADGQDIIQNVLHRRLADAQGRGETTVSAGMVAAGQTLMGDHGGFKSGNRGLNKLSQDLASGKALQSDRGKYATTALKDANGRTLTDKAGNQIYENNHYGAAAAAGTAAELAGANDSTLRGMLSSIQNGNMSTADMEAVYRNAGEAITNDNISVKPENENMLNQIRQAAYEKLQGQQVGGYTDSTGREFAHTGGNNYQYTDSSGNVHNYTRGSGGDLTEVGGSDVVNNSDLTSMSQNYYDDQGRKFVSNGSGTYTYDDGSIKHTYTRNSTTGDFTEVGTGSEVITGNRLKTATDNFGFNYGSSYRNLHTGDTFKIGHNAPATPTKISLPSGWTLTNSGWVDITTGRPLSPMDARRADSIVDHNNQIDNNR